MRGILSYASAGLEFAFTLVLGSGLGLWADRKLGTDPFLLLAGSALGFAAALYHLYRGIYGPGGPGSPGGSGGNTPGGGTNHPGAQ